MKKRISWGHVIWFSVNTYYRCQFFSSLAVYSCSTLRISRTESTGAKCEEQCTHNRKWDLERNPWCAPRGFFKEVRVHAWAFQSLHFPCRIWETQAEALRKEGGCFYAGKFDNGSLVKYKLSILAWWVTSKNSKRDRGRHPVLGWPHLFKG